VLKQVFGLERSELVASDTTSRLLLLVVIFAVVIDIDIAVAVAVAAFMMQAVSGEFLKG
jgi:hypothetical protein